MRIEAKLQQMGLELPPRFVLPEDVRINFRPVRRSGNLLYVSGQGPLWGSEVRFQGKVGAEISLEQAYEAAQLTALNMLRLIYDEIGDLDLVAGWVKVLGFINAVPGFTEQPAVLNGFSDLIMNLYGPERGGHARSAVGVDGLPFNICVEIEGVVEVSL